jgi:UDP-N-acetylglucosamine pyrophosphorylase
MNKAFYITILVFLQTATGYAVDLDTQIQELSPIQQKVLACSSFEEKLAILSELPQVKKFFSQNRDIARELLGLNSEEQYVIKALVALNQGPVLFTGWHDMTQSKPKALKQLAEILVTTEHFYDYMGGVAGYHVKTLQLISEQVKKQAKLDSAQIVIPPVTDIRNQSTLRDEIIASGIMAIEQMAELYVVGGAGDRLALIDEKTGIPLPVACLHFAGRTLLEQLVRDLEAREYLYYKLTGKQVCTPIVLMTSIEKRNDAEIAAILERNNYFGRPKESFFRLLQPMTPVVTIEGNWAVKGTCDLVLKPGGHGVVWKLADENGAFDWLEKQNRSFCIVRQINNPLAGLDHNLLSLAGFGHSKNKAFGFESVPRILNMSEGMNVLRQTRNDSQVESCISNLEYTEFAKRKQTDPEFARVADSLLFPANTNILYANIAQVRLASKKLPVPGYLVNMKHPVETLSDGKKVTLLGARLESTMQNIADVMCDKDKQPLDLRTFVLLNDREKTMSVTKKAYDGKSLAETPEGCFADLMKENLRMLTNNCQFTVEDPNSCMFLYRPNLGPLYSVIGQKMHKGKLAKGSELEIEASEVFINGLSVSGSARLFAENEGSIVFENVQIKNLGIDQSASNCYVKGKIDRKQCAKFVV